MRDSSTRRLLLITAASVAVVVVLGLLRYRPWAQAGDDSGRPKLTVGYLPVT